MYDEMLMLKYIDGKMEKGERENFEKSIMNNQSLMREISELNRINAIMSSHKPEIIPADAFILARFKGKIPSLFESPELQLSINDAVPVRSSETKIQTLSAVSNDFKIEITPSYEGSYWISLSSEHLDNTRVSLYRAGEELPIYSKKAKNSVLIKGVAVGHYILSFASKKIDIRIDSEDVL